LISFNFYFCFSIWKKTKKRKRNIEGVDSILFYQTNRRKSSLFRAKIIDSTPSKILFIAVSCILFLYPDAPNYSKSDPAIWQGAVLGFILFNFAALLDCVLFHILVTISLFIWRVCWTDYNMIIIVKAALACYGLRV